MSYIRATSNPENLYIYCDGKRICIHQRGFYSQIPIYVFHGLLKRFLKNDEYDSMISYRGGKLNRILVAGPDFLKWRLTYKDLRIEMSHVTLFYIAARNKFRWE